MGSFLRHSLILTLLIACSSESSDVTGPFTGEVTRYAIDRFTLPIEDSAVAADLDGDGTPDNQLAIILATLSSQNDITTHAPDMIASGMLASSIELQADDVTNDETVGATYVGADGDAATVAGGKLAGGAFRSNRTRETRVPGRALLRLPMFADADPVVVPLEGLELELAPDGAGGFDGVVRGGILLVEAGPASFASVQQMLRANPAGHRFFARNLDVDRDGTISEAEYTGSALVIALLAADVQLFTDGTYGPTPRGEEPDSLSVAFRVHLIPCAAGTCSTAAPADRCHDRVRDGDETDVDCGGSCGPCPAQAACTVPGDCQSAACDANRCRAGSCTDGVRDGFETDVDCGGNCNRCAVGEACDVSADCASGSCGGGVCAP